MSPPCASATAEAWKVSKSTCSSCMSVDGSSVTSASRWVACNATVVARQTNTSTAATTWRGARGRRPGAGARSALCGAGSTAHTTCHAIRRPAGPGAPGHPDRLPPTDRGGRRLEQGAGEGAARRGDARVVAREQLEQLDQVPADAVALVAVRTADRRDQAG